MSLFVLLERKLLLGEGPGPPRTRAPHGRKRPRRMGRTGASGASGASRASSKAYRLRPGGGVVGHRRAVGRRGDVGGGNT